MEGFAKGAILGEVMLFSNAAFYGVKMNYAFSAYGETVFQLVQSILMVCLFYMYKPPKYLTGYVQPLGVYAAYLAVVFLWLPQEHAHFLPKLNWPMVIWTRGSQIASNYRLKYTGSQSPLTILMQAGGSAVRIFTTLVIIGFDMSLLMGYSLGTGLNLTLLWQWFIYRSNDKPVGQWEGEEDLRDLKKTPKRKTRASSRKPAARSSKKEKSTTKKTPVTKSKKTPATKSMKTPATKSKKTPAASKKTAKTPKSTRASSRIRKQKKA